MMLQVGQRFRLGLQPLTVAEVAAQLRVPAGIVKEFLTQFAERKLLLSLADEDSFVLGRDPATIGIKEIIDCVRGVGKDGKARSKLREDQERLIDAILLEAEQAAARSWEGKTLQALVLALEPTRQ
jgi:DNA-binding IscR family transcriptional regulator